PARCPTRTVMAASAEPVLLPSLPARPPAASVGAGPAGRAGTGVVVVELRVTVVMPAPYHDPAPASSRRQASRSVAANATLPGHGGRQAVEMAGTIGEEMLPSGWRA